MSYRALPLCLTLFVAGCGTIDAMDRDGQTKFKPSADRRTFTFEGQDSHQGAELSPTLTRWLEGWLTDNKMCPRGYTITGQDRVKTYMESYRVTATGRCNA